MSLFLQENAVARACGLEHLEHLSPRTWRGPRHPAPIGCYSAVIRKSLLFQQQCRVKELEGRLAEAEAGRAELEQQLALARSQLADARALMDSAQARDGGHLRFRFWGHACCAVGICCALHYREKRTLRGASSCVLAPLSPPRYACSKTGRAATS